MASDRDEAHPYGLFQSYADDTPRAADPEGDAPEPLAAGWSETPAWGHAEPPPEPPSWRRPLVASGAVIALIAAGVGWAVLREPAAAPEPEPALSAPASPKPLEVVVVAPPPLPPVPRSPERLEVLPRTAATAARTPLAERVIPVVPAAPPPRVTAQAPPPPLPRAAPSAVEAVRDASVRSAPEPRRFDACGDAPTRAYEMVCSDRRLAEADRRMKRAYNAALAAGVPPGALRRDQDDWLEVREEAAQVSPRAVADIYRQRTRELFAMADERRD